MLEETFQNKHSWLMLELRHDLLYSFNLILYFLSGGEWPSGLNSFLQVTKVKLGRVKSDSGWVTKEA